MTLPDSHVMTVALLKAVIPIVGTQLEVAVSDPGSEVQWPVGIKAWLGTDRIGGEIRTSHESRITRCYELAAHALPEAPNGSWLIHGSQHGRYPGNQRIAHAWLEIGGAIWEPITACLYDKEEMTAFSRLWEERRYNLRVAAHHVIESNNSGPWHESRYP